MINLTSNLDQIAAAIREAFTAQDAAREQAIPRCREVIRFASVTIRAVHRHEFGEAAETLSEARRLLDEVEVSLKTCQELQSTHFVWDAEKEYAEAAATLAMATGKPLPTPEELHVDNAAYLNGLGEAANELRRYLLDGMRSGDLSHGEELLTAMDDVYNVLVTMDYPDSITGGLRRTTDVLRGVMEKTRSDLTLSIQQKRLEDTLQKTGHQLA
jgi:translin